MSIAYNGSIETRPDRAYLLKREAERLERQAQGRELDKARLDDIMNRITDSRLARGYIPDRDEDRIAEILLEGERKADEEARLLQESSYYFTIPSDYLNVKESTRDTERKRFTFSRK